MSLHKIKITNINSGRIVVFFKNKNESKLATLVTSKNIKCLKHFILIKGQNIQH